MGTTLRIAIDGGAATGKSTTSKLVAKKLGLTYVNTGQMYRLIALIALKNNLENDEKKLLNKIKDIKMSFDDNGKILNDFIKLDENILDSNEVSNVLNSITHYPLIREFASKKQMEFGKKPGVLLEGRDIGTVVMPDADYKFYLFVDPKVAAKRRVKQFSEMGEQISYEKTLQDIIDRNESDMNRKVGPLMPTKNSIHIDTSFNTAEEVANQIVGIINNG